MANPLRQKEALRAALYAYYAGAHAITETVEKVQSVSSSGSGKDATEMRHAMLEADYQRLRESPVHLIELFCEILDEEDLYPFGGDWPREAMTMLAEKLIPPKLSIDGEDDCKFRFKKGFKELLNDIAQSVTSEQSKPTSLDHWLVVLFNTAFHAGATVAARNAETPKAYFDVITELEEETEPWTRYPQLSDMLDRQLRRETRRKTGLVSDLDY
ncbi:MAG: hypothetical protein HY075_11780 [Deltaproteobacteria bacterium]|nr:hypothetical protein [Deltaproteobacteria bacterium]